MLLFTGVRLQKYYVESLNESEWKMGIVTGANVNFVTVLSLTLK
jgi:hypothetical protein